ncbi:Putative Fe-S cluster [Abditibacterium utsteinense]|uniref:Fe-S cluster n=1 Tax=Abditibacterium utsteinense TaxID=1960156 RepID=A0A2S8SR58_9BACT|nr:(Fe-S)-binding protein [Abditibacterium utsteinense]PQV63302.1 Putative Fe-S cluster [Abditibacterium utsteinense]
MAIPVLPPSAPFTTQQRAYLNGFLAGVCGLDGIASNHQTNGAAISGVPTAMDDASLNRVGSDSGGNDLIAAPAASAAALNGVAASQSEPAPDESAPWHDAALGIAERMELAQDRPLPQKMMAAMAQLDCGQCGYLCKTYAQAIADGDEKSLRKCVPGGKETANQLKALVASA